MNTSSSADARVSYIISTKNRAKFLAETLANVREFITPSDELVIVDGGSTDGTPDVVKANQDIVRVFVSEPDKGEAHGFNKGILLSRGRFIKLVTDDDYLFPAAMQEAIALMEAHPEMDAIVCAGEAHEFDPATQSTRLVRAVYLPPGRRLTEDLVNIMDYATCGIGLLLTRRVIARVGLLDPTFAAVDTDYMGRLIGSGVDFRYAGIKLYRHVEYPHSAELRVGLMNRDRFRVMVRDGRWDLLPGNSRTFPGDASNILSNAMRLDGLRHGTLLARWMLMGEHLRRGRRLSLLFRMMVPLMDALYAVALWLSPGRWLRRGSRESVAPEATPWDGSLQ